MGPIGDRISREMVLVRLLLAGGAATVGVSSSRDKVLLSNHKGDLLVSAESLAALASLGSIKRTGDQVSLVAGASIVAVGQDRVVNPRDIEKRIVETGGVVAEVDVNLAESPLAQLMRRKGKDGNAFLTRQEFEAGERLRRDYTRGRIMPRLGANWEAGVSSGKRGSGGELTSLTDASLAARQRVDRALLAVGPELSGMLVDVCCFLKGLETVERERSWPVRSAKIILKAALSALARHYLPPRPSRPAHALHWGSEDYRPSIG